MVFRLTYLPLLSGLFLALLPTGTFAQDTSRAQYRITTTVTQYLFLDFPVTIEKVVGSRTLGLTLAFRPGTKKSGETLGGKGFAGDYEKLNFVNHRYNAATIGINSKRFNKERSMYWDLQLFYRHWWFTNKYASYKGVESYGFTGLRTERQHVIGLKLLFGRSIHLKGQLNAIIDLYYGLGIRYKTFNFETFNGTVNEQRYAYKLDQGNLWLPSFHLGANIGLHK